MLHRLRPKQGIVLHPLHLDTPGRQPVVPDAPIVGSIDPIGNGGSPRLMNRNVRPAALPAGVAVGCVGVVGAVASAPARRIVLMGGAREVDAGARAFVEGAAGGDVLVLRASGSECSYNRYFFDELSYRPSPSSASTFRFDDPSATSDAAVLDRVRCAGSVWLAGGDQGRYLHDWSSGLHEALCMGQSIGGTSAGAMVLGEIAFDGHEVVRSPLAQPELTGMLIDTHFSQRDREERLIGFLRAAPIDGAIGIGIDEGAALIVEAGRFEVRTNHDDRYVFIYRLEGDEVRRTRLCHGDVKSVLLPADG